MDPALKGTAQLAREHAGAKGHAVVIGGSMAGLLAARVLADHFGQVTIVDRDRFPENPTIRKGVPQAHHFHVLLSRGQQILEGLFPGLGDDLSSAGAVKLEWGYDSLLYTFGVWMPKTHLDLYTHSCSRALLEFSVHWRVAAIENVRILQEREATSLLFSDSKLAVTGIRTRSRGGRASAGADGDAIHADLVVDASGRSSRAPEWLGEAGYPPPQETVVNSFLGYASRLYRPPEGFTADWKALFLRGRASYFNRGGVVFPIEGGRWLVTLAGAGRDYPPLDDAGFLEFTRCLGDPPLLYDVLVRATALGPAVGYQRTDNRWRHYERLERWPENFVISGDAVCAFNPVYGQGMTVAGLDALKLDECLHRTADRNGNLNGLGRRFMKAMAKNLSAPWLMAIGEDFREPQTEGKKPGRILRVMHAYIDRVTIASSHSDQVFRTYVHVTHLLEPPISLFSPAMLARVLIGLPY